MPYGLHPGQEGLLSKPNGTGSVHTVDSPCEALQAGERVGECSSQPTEIRLDAKTVHQKTHHDGWCSSQRM